MVHRLKIAYRGTRFAGWQRQTNAPSVQAAAESALSELLGQTVVLYGAGRTDAGVHADGQIAHFHAEHTMPLTALVHGSNHRLPSDVRLLGVARMGNDFHARKSALGKTYRYRLYRGRVVPPVEAPFTAATHNDLDLIALRRALGRLAGRHDFTAFAAAGGSHTQPFRRIFATQLNERGRFLTLTFFGEGFLRGMVRALVGTLLEVAVGQRDMDDFGTLLTGRPRADAGPTAPAHGLTLARVHYGPQWRPTELYRT